jgi:DNA (cytosine-5)-methyltransferase 1
MKTVDLFCGCGGLSLGFQRAGYEIVGAFDCWEPALNCYTNNFKHKAHYLDLSKKNIALKKIRPLNPDIIIGGPPCQDFSSAGKREEGDRASLTITFAKIINSIRPKYFVMENVARAKTSDAYNDAKKLFKKAGYGLTEQVLDASKCGVPQKRKRFFCIGALNEDDGFLDTYLAANQSVLPLCIRTYFNENNYNLHFEYYYRHPRTYSRRAIFSVDEPSPTIRGVNRPKPPEYKKHPNDAANPDKVRSLTTQERALLQTFPESYDFGNNQMIAEQMIGNAVPVNLSNHVARSLLSFINHDTQSQSIEFINWLQQEHNYTQLAAKDVISHLSRCNRILSVANLPEQEYLEQLEKKETFRNLSKSIRSQLKRSIILYAEYKQGSHNK